MARRQSNKRVPPQGQAAMNMPGGRPSRFGYAGRGEEGVGGGGPGEAMGVWSLSSEEESSSASSSQESTGADVLLTLILGVALESCAIWSWLSEVWRACAEACVEVCAAMVAARGEREWLRDVASGQVERLLGDAQLFD